MTTITHMRMCVKQKTLLPTAIFLKDTQILNSVTRTTINQLIIETIYLFLVANYFHSIRIGICHQLGLIQTIKLLQESLSHMLTAYQTS